MKTLSRRILVLSSTLVVSWMLAHHASAASKTFTGVITDSECENADHSHMRMGTTDAECAIACVEAHGAWFVLFTDGHSYRLSDQSAARTLAGQKVDVVGSLDEKTKTITVESIKAARSAG